MKTFNIKSIIIIALAAGIIVSCKQEVITLTPPENPTPETPTGSKGNADFSKYVSIGNSLTAGYQAGALFTEGQQNSFPLILSKQFSIAQGATLTFNQPDINSVNGYNSSYSSPPSVVRGRLVLFAADGVQAHAVPFASAHRQETWAPLQRSSYQMSFQRSHRVQLFRAKCFNVKTQGRLAIGNRFFFRGTLPNNNAPDAQRIGDVTVGEAFHHNSNLIEHYISLPLLESRSGFSIVRNGSPSL